MITAGLLAGTALAAGIVFSFWPFGLNPVAVGGTGLKVYFSRWVDLIPDGTPIEGRGVPPRVPVDEPEESYRAADPTLAKGLEVLRGKIRGGK